MGLKELTPVGGRPSGGRHGRRLEWFAQMREDLPDRPRLRDEGNEPDVATTPRALERDEEYLNAIALGRVLKEP